MGNKTEAEVIDILKAAHNQPVKGRFMGFRPEANQFVNISKLAMDIFKLRNKENL